MAGGQQRIGEGKEVHSRQIERQVQRHQYTYQKACCTWGNNNIQNGQGKGHLRKSEVRWLKEAESDQKVA